MKDQGIIVDENFNEDKQVFLKYMSVVDNGVLELIILPTMNCNFKCPYCYEDRTGKLSERLMKIAKAYHILYSSNITTNGYLVDI